MASINKLLVLLFCIIAIKTCLVLADERKEEKFYVKPGAGSLSVELQLKDYTCKFTYTAQGGTHEEWLLTLQIYDGNIAVMCTAERGIPSYLFFQDFKLELTGPKVTIRNVVLLNSQRDNLILGKEEYSLENNSVASVLGKFKNHLEKVEIYSPLRHDDL